MWKWQCPKESKLVWEHHSFKLLDEHLNTHEVGINVSGGVRIEGFGSFPACEEIHDYWDDGVPCGQRNCRIPYVPEDVV
jgi:hypothetical protein